MGGEGCSPFLSICCHQVENTTLAATAGKQEPAFRVSRSLSLCFIHRESTMWLGCVAEPNRACTDWDRCICQWAPQEARGHGLVLSPAVGSAKGSHPKPNPRAVPTPHCSLTPFSPSPVSHSSRGTCLQNKCGQLPQNNMLAISI